MGQETFNRGWADEERDPAQDINARYAIGQTLEGNRGHLDDIVSIDQASDTLRAFRSRARKR